MKTYSTLILTFLICTRLSFAQSETSSQVIYENDLGMVSVQKTDCVDHANGTAKVYMLIKAENKSANPIQVSFKKNLWFNGECISCGSLSDEYNISLELEPNEIQSGSCSESNGLRIFVRMIELKDVRQLTNYELDNIQISTL